MKSGLTRNEVTEINDIYTKLAGEDTTNDVMKTEQRFSYSALLVADGIVKTGAGFLHTVTISNIDIAATAGTIEIYDGTSAAGTKLFTIYVPVANVLPPYTLIFDVSVGTGIFIDFTTVADVGVQVSYR